MASIKIIPEKFYWEAKKREWSPKQQAILNQLNLFNEKKPLEKLPYRFKLKYKCAGNPACTGHDQGILIWNFYEGYRQFVKKYKSEEETLRKIEEAAKRDFFNENRECYAILGNLAHYKMRKTWIIGGFFAPKKSSFKQGRLFLIHTFIVTTSTPLLPPGCGPLEEGLLVGLGFKTLPSFS